MIIKLVSCAAVGAGTWALIAYVFGATGQNGISFLNKASLEEYKKKQQSETDKLLVDHLLNLISQ